MQSATRGYAQVVMIAARPTAAWRAFTDEVWVTGEIRGFKESRGHRYLELADHDATPTRGGAQQLEVVCWSRDWPRVARQLQEARIGLAAVVVVSFAFWLRGRWQEGENRKIS